VKNEPEKAPAAKAPESPAQNEVKPAEVVFKPIESSLKSEVKEPPAPAPAPIPVLREAAPMSLASEIERLRLNWKQILETVPASLKRSSAVALLRSAGGKPVSIENNTVVLSLKYSIHKDKMEKPEYQQVAEKIISDYLGHACKVQFICETENNHLVRHAIKKGAQIISVEEK